MGYDGEEEGGSAVGAGNQVEGEQGERVRWRLQVVLQWCRREREKWSGDSIIQII